VPQDSLPALQPLLLRFRRGMPQGRPASPECSPSVQLLKVTLELSLMMEEEPEPTSAHRPPTSPEVPPGMF